MVVNEGPIQSVGKVVEMEGCERLERHSKLYLERTLSIILCLLLPIHQAWHGACQRRHKTKY